MVRRDTATKQAIKQAFTELIAEKGLDRLSVSDVARRAGLNRGTVYLHYTDKYDLLAQLEQDALDELVRILFAEDDAGAPVPDDLVSDRAIDATLRYIQRDSAFFTALTGPGGDPEFVERLKAVISQRLYEELEHPEALTQRMDGIPREYAREIVLGGIMAIITLWLRRGATEPVELIVRLIDTAKRVAPLDLLG